MQYQGNPRNAYHHDTQRINPENYLIFKYIYNKYYINIV